MAVSEPFITTFTWTSQVETDCRQTLFSLAPFLAACEDFLDNDNNGSDDHVYQTVIKMVDIEELTTLDWHLPLQ